ncbi:myo-inosose-2 dehydratase [Methylovulum psychrotolerans]|uniref:Myo-inosose-2 dehydratase n=2 Tax=Methylovulum psychrotolerans TaxID=1704499 RepID=A0A2S5CH62_9GAMM|nr:myo-inosose-2 dehydratase [Methylovulum psychrotolerans]MBT9099724.1 myo-inosose-2 dehydratase [Methylovulum psychrotolerans]POZ50148.1 myo-inosose-2 dehydratase [Methylovulum psychrotolerans]
MNNSNYFTNITLRRAIAHCLLAAMVGGMVLASPAAVAESAYAKAKITAPTTKTLFDPSKVFLGITPTGWVNDDDPTIDDDIGFKQIVSEMALAGFQGSSVGHKYPTDTKVLTDELNLRGLKISEPWVGTYYTIKAMDEQTLETFKKQMAFIKTMGGTDIVVAELGNAVHQQPVAVLPNKPEFTDAQWKALLDGLNMLGALAEKEGMRLCYHPHVGTGVEKAPDIDRLMAGTDPKYVHLLLDTGHLFYAGVDPLAIATKYASRIKHVHLKNIRKSVLDSSVASNSSFLDSIRAGVFTVPGDSAGAINFKPILETLAAANYQGWLVVEAEQDPKKANPLVYAQMARQYLRETIGF